MCDCSDRTLLIASRIDLCGVVWVVTYTLSAVNRVGGIPRYRDSPLPLETSGGKDVGWFAVSCLFVVLIADCVVDCVEEGKGESGGTVLNFSQCHDCALSILIKG